MENPLAGVWRFYVDGFKNMTSGRTLWVIILVKLFVLFFILKLFFFPDFLAVTATDGDKDGYVSRELVMRAGDSAAPQAGATVETDCNQRQY